MPPSSLKRSIGPLKGTLLLLNIVIGAGLLSLPGLAIKEIGGLAFSSWIVCGACAAPLLILFTLLGTHHPEAGGITTYARYAFGSMGERIAAFLFLGSVIFGLPAIAVTGGHYLSALWGGSPYSYAALLILFSLLPHLIPGEGAGKILSLIGFFIISILTIALITGLWINHTHHAYLPIIWPHLYNITTLMTPFMMLFFAFGGWEIGAGMVEEFKKPIRDYPLSMALSFIITCILYFGIAYVLQSINLTGYYNAPFIPLLTPVLGHHGIGIISATTTLIIFGNLSGAVWGISRTVYALGKASILPSILGRTYNGQPLLAVITTTGILYIVLCLGWSNLLQLDKMFSLASQNFLLIYALCSIALLRLTKTLTSQLLAIGTLIESTIIFIKVDHAPLYTLTLIISAIIFHVVQTSKKYPT